MREPFDICRLFYNGKKQYGIRSRQKAGYWVCQDLWELKKANGLVLRSTGSEAGGGPGAGEYVVVCLCVDIIIHFSFRTTKQASSEKVTKCALFKMCISEAIICEE